MKNKKQQNRQRLLKESAQKLGVPENMGRLYIVDCAANKLGRFSPRDRNGQYELLKTFLGVQAPPAKPFKPQQPPKTHKALPPPKPRKWPTETRRAFRYKPQREPFKPLSEIDPTTDDFLRGYQWRRLRMEVLKARGRRCECCGANPTDGVTILHVDHIEGRRKHPELALEFTNLQVLCEACNHGKGNWDETDWRDKTPTTIDADPITEQPCWAPHVTPFKNKSK